MKLLTTLFVITLGAFTAQAELSNEEVCADLHPFSSASIKEECSYNFNQFREQQVLFSMGEQAKSVLKSPEGQNVAQTILSLAQSTALIGFAQGRLAGFHTGENVSLGALNHGTGSGISCERAVHYDLGDEDPTTIDGHYACAMNFEVFVIYMYNSCDYENQKIWNQKVEQLTVNFEMTEEGHILPATIKTKEFEVIRSCAG